MGLKNAASAATIACCLLQATAYAQSATSEGPIDTIVVTAQHRQESAQDVPISLSALGGDALAEQNISSIQDLAGAVPGLVVSKSVSYGLAPIAIRGLGGPAGGGSLFTDQPVAVYVDGVYVPALAQSVSDFLDVDSLVVLRGPQGTLYGRNSTAGALLITSKRPSDEFGGEARVSYGSFDALSASGAINLPLIEDRLAFRLAVGHNSGGDWANNTVDNREFGGGRSTTVRGSLRYTPSDAVTIDLIGDHSGGRSRPATVPLVSAAPIFAGPALGAVYFGSPFARRVGFDDILDSRDVQIVGNQITETKASDFTGLVEWDLGAVKLSSASGYRKFRVHGEQDSSPFTTPAALLGFNNTEQRQESYSQELRLSSPDEGRFKWTVGGYYFHQNTDAFISITNVQGGPPVATGFGPGGPIFAGMPSGTLADFSAQQEVDAYAAFLDATFDITDTLSVTGGVRYSRDEKKAEIANLITTITPTVLAGPTLLSASCPNATIDCTADFDDVSPRGVLNFRPVDNSLFYFSYSQGFNSGGFNNFGNVLNPTDPTNPLENSSENIVNYEIGTKNDLFDGALRLNLTAFLSNYEDLHIRQGVVTGGVSIVNVPKARVKGVEFEGIASPVEGLTLTTNFAYMDSEILEGSLGALSSASGPVIVGGTVSIGLEDVSGNRLTRAPKWQGYASARYEFPVSFGTVSATGTLRYQGKTYFLETNQDTAQWLADSWQEVGVRVAATDKDGKWELAAYGANLFDNRHISQLVPFFAFPIATVNDPRSWGVELSVKF